VIEEGASGKNPRPLLVAHVVITSATTNSSNANAIIAAHETACRTGMSRYGTNFTIFQYELYNARNINQVTPLGPFSVRVEPPAHHSTIPEPEALDALVPCRYDYIHARLCGAGVLCT
jgi:hypothetical protein